LRPGGSGGGRLGLPDGHLPLVGRRQSQGGLGFAHLPDGHFPLARARSRFHQVGLSPRRLRGGLGLPHRRLCVRDLFLPPSLPCQGQGLPGAPFLGQRTLCPFSMGQATTTPATAAPIFMVRASSIALAATVSSGAERRSPLRRSTPAVAAAIKAIGSGTATGTGILRSRPGLAIGGRPPSVRAVSGGALPVALHIPQAD